MEYPKTALFMQGDRIMPDNRIIKLDEQAVFQVGDTTIIASGHYKDDGEDCFERISNVLKEEIQKQSCE